MKEPVIPIPPRHEPTECKWQQVPSMTMCTKATQVPRFNMKLVVRDSDKNLQIPSSRYIPPACTTTPPPEAPTSSQDQPSSGPAISSHAPSPVGLSTQLSPPPSRSTTALQQPASSPTQHSTLLLSSPPHYTKSPHHLIRHATSLHAQHAHHIQALSSLSSEILSLLPALPPLSPYLPPSSIPIIAPPPSKAQRYSPLTNYGDTQPSTWPESQPQTLPVSSTVPTRTIRDYLTSPQLLHTASLYQGHLLETALLDAEIELIHLAARRMNISIPIPIPTPASMNRSTPAPKGEGENKIRPAAGGESDSRLFPPDLTIRAWKTERTWKDAKGRWEDIQRGEELIRPLVGVVGGVWVKGKGVREGEGIEKGQEHVEEKRETEWACWKDLERPEESSWI